MLREKKGVTLTVLVISIILMIIIFSITISAGTTLLSNSNANKMKTNLYLVRARAENVLEDYLFDGTDNLGSTITDSSFITNVGFIEDSSTYIYRLWDSSRLKEEGIDTENVSSNEYFVIQYNIVDDVVDVASTKGYTDEDGETTYILSEFE